MDAKVEHGADGSASNYFNRIKPTHLTVPADLKSKHCAERCEVSSDPRDRTTTAPLLGARLAKLGQCTPMATKPIMRAAKSAGAKARRASPRTLRALVAAYDGIPNIAVAEMVEVVTDLAGTATGATCVRRVPDAAVAEMVEPGAFLPVQTLDRILRGGSAGNDGVEDIAVAKMINVLALSTGGASVAAGRLLEMRKANCCVREKYR